MSVIRTLTAGSLVALVGGVIPGAALSAAAGELPKLAAPKTATEADQPPPVPASAEAGAEWYVVIDGVKVGPLTEEALMKRLDRGEIDMGTLIWRSGMSDWQTVAETETIVAKRVSAAIRDWKPKTPLDEKFGTLV